MNKYELKREELIEKARQAIGTTITYRPQSQSKQIHNGKEYWVTLNEYATIISVDSFMPNNEISISNKFEIFYNKEDITLECITNISLIELFDIKSHGDETWNVENFFENSVNGREDLFEFLSYLTTLELKSENVKEKIKKEVKEEILNEELFNKARERHGEKAAEVLDDIFDDSTNMSSADIDDIKTTEKIITNTLKRFYENALKPISDGKLNITVVPTRITNDEMDDDDESSLLTIGLIDGFTIHLANVSYEEDNHMRFYRTPTLSEIKSYGIIINTISANDIIIKPTKYETQIGILFNIITQLNNW